MLYLILSLHNKTEIHVESEDFNVLYDVVEKVRQKVVDDFGYLEIPMVDAGMKGVAIFRPEEICSMKVLEVLDEAEQKVADQQQLLDKMRPGRYT